MTPSRPRSVVDRGTIACTGPSGNWDPCTGMQRALTVGLADELERSCNCVKADCISRPTSSPPRVHRMNSSATSRRAITGVGHTPSCSCDCHLEPFALGVTVHSKIVCPDWWHRKQTWSNLQSLPRLHDLTLQNWQTTTPLAVLFFKSSFRLISFSFLMVIFPMLLAPGPPFLHHRRRCWDSRPCCCCCYCWCCP